MDVPVSGGEGSLRDLVQVLTEIINCHNLSQLTILILLHSNFLQAVALMFSEGVIDNMNEISRETAVEYCFCRFA